MNESRQFERGRRGQTYHGDDLALLHVIIKNLAPLGALGSLLAKQVAHRKVTEVELDREAGAVGALPAPGAANDEDDLGIQQSRRALLRLFYQRRHSAWR